MLYFSFSDTIPLIIHKIKLSFQKHKLNEIDPELRSANFRIGIFHSEGYGKGIGSWAIHTYEKTGFKHEGVLRDAVKDGDSYGDDILMAIPEDEWRQMKERMSTSH